MFRVGMKVVCVDASDQFNRKFPVTKGKTVVLVYPVDKWLLMLVKAIFGEKADIRNLGDVKWIATEDQSVGKGTGRHIACFILRSR